MDIVSFIFITKIASVLYSSNNRQRVKDSSPIAAVDSISTDYLMKKSPLYHIRAETSVGEASSVLVSEHSSRLSGNIN